MAIASKKPKRTVATPREKPARDKLVALAEASREIAAELSSDRLLQRIADHARRIVGCQYAALGVFNEDKKLVQFIFSGLDQAGAARIASRPTGKGLLGAVLASHEPLIVDDISRHPDSVGFPSGHPGMKNFLGVAVRYQGKTLGNLYLTDKPGTFTQEDAHVVSLFAAQAAVALDNARLFAEAEARRQDANAQRLFLETVLNGMAEAVYTLDPALRITRANQFAANIVDQKLDRIVGRNCWEIFPYATLSGSPICFTACPARQAIASGKPVYIMDATLRVSETREVPVSILATAIRNDAGEVVAVVETFRDVTARKEVDELRDSIISLVSHELRTPLSHIKGFASSLLQPDVQWDEETRLDFLRTIDREADRLSKLVNDLLEMSRLESGRHTMNIEALEPAKMVATAVQRMAPFLRDHHLVNRVSSALPMIAVDSGQAERVIENLLENAAKYSPSGSEIVLTGERDGAYLRIGVYDQGIGIPQQDRERIFEKFVRLEQDQRFRSPGTGLGLSICKAIVQAHGGSIWVEPNQGAGSIFYFTVPLAMGREAYRGTADS